MIANLGHITNIDLTVYHVHAVYGQAAVYHVYRRMDGIHVIWNLLLKPSQSSRYSSFRYGMCSGCGSCAEGFFKSL